MNEQGTQQDRDTGGVRLEAPSIAVPDPLRARREGERTGLTSWRSGVSLREGQADLSRSIFLPPDYQGNLGEVARCPSSAREVSPSPGAVLAQHVLLKKGW